MPVTTPPALSAIPAFPALSERAAGTYNANAYACLNHWATTGGPQLAALANNVAGNATDAAGSASSAATAKGDAESAATNAAGSVLLAYNWAVKTDGPVSGGEYSARYWAQQAAAVVATIPTGTINDAVTSGTSVWSSSKVSTELGEKQAALVSGTSIKTINGVSLLGSGNVVTTSGVGASSVTASVTLTNASNPAQRMNPSTWGQTFTLPNATTMADVGVQLFGLTNAGAYPVRVCDSTGTLLGFIPPSARADVDLIDKSTAAGLWWLSGVDPIGVSSALPTSGAVISTQYTDGGAGPTIAIALSPSVRLVFTNNGYAAVHDKSTGVIGALTLIANVTGGKLAAVAIDATRALVVYSTGTTNLSAVVLTVSGTSISVGTPATIVAGNTVSEINGLISINGSFVVAHTISTPACRITAITVSGTTPTFGSQTTMGTREYAKALFTVSGSQGVAFCTDTSQSQSAAVPFTVSGTTITVGTAATWGNTSPTVTAFSVARLGSRFVACHAPGNGALVSIGSNTATASAFSVDLIENNNGNFSLVPLTSTKLAICNGYGSPNFRILTDNAGTASIGSALNLVFGGGTARNYAPVIHVDTSTNSWCAMAFGFDTTPSSTYNYRSTFHYCSFSGAAPTTLTIQTSLSGDKDAASATSGPTTFPPPPHNAATSWTNASVRCIAGASEMVLNRYGKTSYVIGCPSGVVTIGDTAFMAQYRSLPFIADNLRSSGWLLSAWAPTPTGTRLSETEVYVASGSTMFAVECVA